jgi:Fur family transcriptional regulator, ferric uptake regulator
MSRNWTSMLKKYDLLNAVEAQGIRLTAQRRALLETIQQATSHLDAASLLKLARERDPNIDRATVYRTIELLKRLGMIDELDLMHLNGEKHYYEVKTQKDHLHLACFNCGEIVEFTSPTFERLKREISAKNDFDIRVMRLEVGGLCGKCAAQKKVLQ